MDIKTRWINAGTYGLALALAFACVACAAGSKSKFARSVLGPAPAAAPVSTASPAPAAVGQAIAGTPGQNTPAVPEQLVIEAWLDLAVDDVGAAAIAIHGWVTGVGGRVVNENLSGGVGASNGQLVLKIPPSQLNGILARAGQHYEVTSKRVQSTDVSRTLHDQEIALDNLTRTLRRLHGLLEREGLQMQEILAIEKEMTRLRGEIERIKGEKRYLEHRVALATLTIGLSRHTDVVLRPQARLYPGPRLSAMMLVNPGDREQLRVGGGVTVHIIPRLTLELDVFEGTGSEDRSLLATFGGATYSDFLGRGKRRFLNPYLGLRLGYGYLEGSRFAFAGGGGVELFKHEYALIDANINVVGLVGERFDAAVVGSASVVFAF